MTKVETGEETEKVTGKEKESWRAYVRGRGRKSRREKEGVKG